MRKAFRKSRRGLLHRQLGVPVGQKIPLNKLRWATHQPGKLGQRARAAMTARRIQQRRKKRSR